MWLLQSSQLRGRKRFQKGARKVRNGGDSYQYLRGNGFELVNKRLQLLDALLCVRHKSVSCSLQMHTLDIYQNV
jgi:hypothetical protein